MEMRGRWGRLWGGTVGGGAENCTRTTIKIKKISKKKKENESFLSLFSESRVVTYK